MKNLTKIIFFFLFTWLSYPLTAQDKCTVLKPEIAGKYIGKCKNGLAQGNGQAIGQDTYVGSFKKGLPHGEGTYTWANGDSYVGNWEEGLRQGEGTMKFRSNGKDTAMTGLWDKDLYKGPLPPKPVVMKSVSIDRYTINKSGGRKDRVLINFYQVGARNTTIENLMLTTSSGTDANLGQSVGYENIIFPVTIKVTYTTWNKLHKAQFDAIFEFEIFEPGDWVVDLHN
ncbi:MAG: hypothetical protein NTX61_08765 [Bacteroidetes bacterium]|nr:hypothetical protein [Bacteroidota bacterium]